MIGLDYKLALNVLGLLIIIALFALTARRGATDVVCGMKVDRAKALTKKVAGRAYYFCSEHCLHAFEADPERYHRSGEPPSDRTDLERKVTDPVCGMRVDTDSALRSAHHGRVYVFCSPGCRDTFERDPDAYTFAPAGAADR